MSRTGTQGNKPYIARALTGASSSAMTQAQSALVTLFCVANLQPLGVPWAPRRIRAIRQPMVFVCFLGTTTSVPHRRQIRRRVPCTPYPLYQPSWRWSRNC